MIRDFDLIAIPWTPEACPPRELVLALKEVCSGVFHTAEFDHLIDPEKHGTEKPHGRRAWSLHLTNEGAAGPYLDLSVMPLIPQSQP